MKQTDLFLLFALMQKNLFAQSGNKNYEVAAYYLPNYYVNSINNRYLDAIKAVFGNK